MTIFKQLFLTVIAMTTISISASAACLLGDISGNGKVSGLDASYARRYLAGILALTECQRLSADVDADGKITRGDAFLISEYVVQNLTALPAQFGDVLFEGKASSKSAAAVMQYLQGTRKFSEAQKHLADVNGDGSVDNLDVKLILEYSANSLPKLPIPK